MRQLGDVIARGGSPARTTGERGAVVRLEEAPAAILARPPTEALAGILEASSGKLVRTGTGWGYPRLPDDRDGAVLREAATRHAAALAVLQPAEPNTVRAWMLALATWTERAPEGEALDDVIDVAVGGNSLPSCCFTPATMRAVAKANDNWWPKPGKMFSLLEPYAESKRELVRRLAIAVERLQAAAARDAADPVTDALTVVQVCADLERYEAAPRGACAVQARAYLTVLRRRAPELADRYGARFEALMDVGREKAAAVRPSAPLPSPTRTGSFRETNPLIVAARTQGWPALPGPMYGPAAVSLED